MGRPKSKGGGAQAPPPTAVSAPAPAGGPQETYELGGRRFVSVGESTVEHDDWFMVRLEKAGLVEVMMGEHEKADDFAVRVLRDVLRSGCTNELIGSLIIPEGNTGLDWTPAMATETANFIGALHTPEDKAVRRELVTSLLIHFFANGLVSLVRSRGSSGTLDQPERIEPDEPTAMDGGANSSAPSPGTTTSERSG